jgi:hypothetical protein
MIQMRQILTTIILNYRVTEKALPVQSNVLHMWDTYNWVLFDDAMVADISTLQKKKKHHRHWDKSSNYRTPSMGYCLSHCTTVTCTLSANVST